MDPNDSQGPPPSQGPPGFSSDPGSPQRPADPLADPDFGKPRDPRFEMNPELDPAVRGEVGEPLSVSATVSQAFSLYRADLLKLWAVTAVIAIPWVILMFILRDASLPSGSTLSNGNIYLTTPGESAGTYNLVSVLGQALQSVVLLVAVGATYRILLGRRLHHPASGRTAFAFAVERAPKLLLLSITVFIVVAVGFICLIIPGIYLVIALSLAVPVLMAEDLDVFASLGRSRELVRDCWWHVLGSVLVAGLVVGIFDLVFEALIAHAIVHSSHSPVSLIAVSEILQAFFLIVVSPFTAAVTTVIYVDMLLRKRDPHLARLLA